MFNTTYPLPERFRALEQQTVDLQQAIPVDAIVIIYSLLPFVDDKCAMSVPYSSYQ